MQLQRKQKPCQISLHLKIAWLSARLRYLQCVCYWDADLSWVINLYIWREYDQNIIITEMWPRQNGRHFVEDILECIFFNQNVCIFINISSHFIPMGPMCWEKEIFQNDTRFFGAEVVKHSGYLYTLFSVMHFSLFFWLSFKRFYH